MLSYKDYFTNEDMKPRGYDFMADGVLDDTHFQSKEEACDDFMQNSFNIVHGLIKKRRGRQWTDAFFEDMKKQDLTGKAIEYQEALKQALIEQAIYTYDNGDASASKYEGESAYAPKAVSALWDFIIF